MPRPGKPRSIKIFFRFVTIFPIVFFNVLVVTMTLLAFFYARTNNIALFIAIIVFALFMIAFYVSYSIYVIRQFRVVFIDGLYGITISNFQNIARNENDFREYPSKQYVEINALNEHVDVLRKELIGATVIPNENNFEGIELDYLDKERNLVTFESFKRELDNIIFKSQNYRNIIIETYYELEDEHLTKKNIDYILKVLRENFYDYENPLYVLGEESESVYLYLPRIDSLSKIREQLETCLRSASISKRLAEGITPLTAHFSVVCYPFSDVQELLPDLRYAKRQGNDIFFYLPNRLNSIKNSAILRNSTNLNSMSKIIAPLSTMKLGFANSAENNKIVESTIKTIAQYFDIDYVGIISLDAVNKRYVISYQANDEEINPLSHDGEVNQALITIMDETKDENGSYYFSIRNHANNALGRHLDRIGLESGFYYVIKNNDLVQGVVYFFNKNKELKFDSYIQESMLMLCTRIGSFIISEKRDSEIESSFDEIDAILKIADFSTYRVSADDYTLLNGSQTMHRLFPNIKYGEKCYKALYGLDAPCKDCPLLTGNKKMVKYGRDNYETSLLLSDHRNVYRVLSIKNIYSHKSHGRYNQDLLINSFHTLVENLDDIYTMNGKGYLLLLRIDNLEQLVEEHGSEGTLSILRDFTKRIKKAHHGLENIFYYTNQFLAMLFYEYGQTDILEECEKIYAIAKNVDKSADYVLNITFLPVSYPRAFPNAASLIKQADVFSTRGRYEVNKDYIYFDENDYSRSANRDEYILSIIKKAFGDKTYGINLQPMVNAADKQIYGAELLLRISDDYRNVNMRTDEVVNVAAKHNQIGIISHALLDFTASLYKEYGALFFSSLGFRRFGLNTDYSFFTDKNFAKDIKKYIEDLKLPKHFIAFEIPENDVSTHIDEFKRIGKVLRELNIVLVCDQYTGRYISIEILKEIGFDEVKISRNLVNHIDSDNQRYNALKALLQLIRRFDMKASIVGVENIDQYLLIKEVEQDVLLQGFYFFRPLEKQALIEALRGTNRYKKADED